MGTLRSPRSTETASGLTQSGGSFHLRVGPDQRQLLIDPKVNKISNFSFRFQFTGVAAPAQLEQKIAVLLFTQHGQRKAFSLKAGSVLHEKIMGPGVFLNIVMAEFAVHDQGDRTVIHDMGP